jgi:hypothetical protein
MINHSSVHAAHCRIGLRRCGSIPGSRVWQIAALSALIRAAVASADAAQAAQCCYRPSLMQLKSSPQGLANRSSLKAAQCCCDLHSCSPSLGLHAWPIAALSRLLIPAVAFADAAQAHAQAQIAALCTLLNTALAFADAAQA